MVTYKRFKSAADLAEMEKLMSAEKAALDVEAAELKVKFDKIKADKATEEAEKKVNKDALTAIEERLETAESDIDAVVNALAEVILI